MQGIENCFLHWSFHVLINRGKNTDMFQNISAWLQANSSWLQAAAAVLQAFAAVVAIPVAYIAAYRSAGRNARQAFELSEKREKKKLDDQIALLRLLLGLEIQRNLDELRRFRNNFLMGTDPEATLGELEQRHDTDAEISEQPDHRRRFIALYLPDLSYRFWHSQQLSSLLPVALTRTEIHRINLIYSNFDRLLKIRAIFGEKAGRHDDLSFRNLEKRDFKESMLSLSSAELNTPELKLFDIGHSRH
jgi:hypothetical protein